MFDVIVVGARVAGSATAMLLARRGLRVLVVDRATFPSDTLSTHQVQVPGIARLARWGLLDRVVSAGTPPTRRLRFDAGVATLEGAYPSFEGVDALFSPRRTILDAILVDAAREAGAEVREGFTVDGLTFDGGRVTGIRGRTASAPSITEASRLVVGADGKHSLVANAAGAPVTLERPRRTFMYYSYWDGVPAEGGTIVARSGGVVGAWPTNGEQVLVVVAGPADGFAAFRSDIAAGFERALDGAGELGERIRAGRLADRYRGSADLPTIVRRPHGPGWALVGDAGLVIDPVTGQGIGHGLRDAEVAAAAIESGLGPAGSLDGALAGYARRRDAETLPMLEFTEGVAAFAPPGVEQRELLRAIAHRPAEVSAFFGVLTGTTPVDEYFAPAHLRRVVGLGGFARILAARLRRRPTGVARPAPAPLTRPGAG